MTHDSPVFAAPHRMQRVLWGISAAAVALALLLAWRQGASLTAVTTAVASLPLGLVAAVFGLSLANYLLRFWRWEALIGPSAVANLSRWRHLLIYVAGFSLTLTPAKAGEALRTVYLLPHGIPAAHSLACLAVERLLDVLAVAALSVLVVTVWPSGWALAIPVLVVGALAVAMLLRAATRRQPGRPPEERKGWRYRAYTMTQAFAGFGVGPLRVALPLSLLGWALEAAGLALLVWHFAPEVSPWTVAGIFGAAILGGALTFLPGGLGGTEALMVTLLTVAGLPAAAAVAATAVCRLATLWFGFVLGLIALPFAGNASPRHRRGA